MKRYWILLLCVLLAAVAVNLVSRVPHAARAGGPVREARANVGAGFVYLVCGDMRTMPGLSSSPAAERIDIDDQGNVVGLY